MRHLLAPLVATLLVFAGPVLRGRRRRRFEAARLLVELPDVIDLLGVAARSGMTVRQALELVAEVAAEPFASALARICRAASLGARLADELVAIESMGVPARPLARALAACERDGTPLGGVLDQLAADARLARRRAAEESIRKAPVLLLLPLVVCVLPAFALLTVVPLVGAGLGSLQL